MAFADGQWDALAHYKLAAPRLHPTVGGSTLLSGRGASPELPANAVQQLSPPTSPDSLKKVFDIQEQGKTRLEPARKLATEALCTTCRRPRHYGPCRRPEGTRGAGVPQKAVIQTHG